MTKEERHTYILEQLMKQSSVQVSELAELLNVSSVTIRKDLTELEKNGRLYRSHGKAILINPFANNRSVNEKESLNAEEKQLIGMEAAQLVVDTACFGYHDPCVGTQSSAGRQAHRGLCIVASHGVSSRKREHRHHSDRRKRAPQQPFGGGTIQRNDFKELLVQQVVLGC